MPNTLEPRWLSVNDAARLMSVSRTTINNYREKGLFPKPIEFGGRVAFLREEVLAFMAKFENARPEQDRIGEKRRTEMAAAA
ncbi:MAG: helix-turn-helix domain-containing protein [Rhizobiaceae bacterium]|uniref:helix-turn-helix transcriptional regulator n=1 Tax=Parvibaculum sp. TaxID=2024848 RepID=UPI001B213A40|nr:helix-turn-helix domain-containing protein [Parvibaculum sp.]MBO6636267.1 helix-turn-helix domain-containing protein [Parvibaculum sp.]MBO6724288.1 helix-turn-helix domain-containing protein [Rhizobiaceae bacterium]